MGRPQRRLPVVLKIALAAIVGFQVQTAQAQSFGSSELPPSAQSIRVTEVVVDSAGSTGDPERDARIRSEAASLLPISQGGLFDPLVADTAVVTARRIDGVRNASWRLTTTVNPDGARLTVTLSLSADAVVTSGYFQTGTGFPTLYRNDRRFLAASINGGSGFFTDLNPWFRQPGTFTRRNPLVEEPSVGAGTGASAVWTEQYVEYGLNGMTQFGDTSTYGYAALTGLTAFSTGQDIFRENTRSTSGIEKAYVGLLYVDPNGKSSGSLTVGRQNFTLNDGFLVAQYGSQANAGPRPGIFLAPRTTHDRSVVAQARSGPWGLQIFGLDPNEFEPIESDTVLLGTNLRYSFSKSAYWDVTWLRVPRSDTRYPVPDGDPLSREGLKVAAIHGRWADPDVLRGLWLETEVARQSNSNFPMEAWGWYGTIGYLSYDSAWTPSISYRYASLDGDDPSTPTYERYDGLFSGGLNEWLQGITINKVLTNSNRDTHRVRANVSPKPGLNLTLDWFHHRARELNNLGGNPGISTLQSRDLGSELQFVTRWPIARRLYFVGVLSRASPGDALKAATPEERSRPWSSVQAQFYWNF